MHRTSAPPPLVSNCSFPSFRSFKKKDEFQLADECSEMGSVIRSARMFCSFARFISGFLTTISKFNGLDFV